MQLEMSQYIVFPDRPRWRGVPVVDTPLTSPNRKRKRERYLRTTAVWLDFSSPLCSDLRVILPGIGSGLDRRHEEIPVAVTVMVGRETIEAEILLCGGRVEAILGLLNLTHFGVYKYRGDFEYIGIGGTKMLTVLTTMRGHSEEVLSTKFREMEEARPLQTLNS